MRVLARDIGVKFFAFSRKSIFGFSKSFEVGSVSAFFRNVFVFVQRQGFYFFGFSISRFWEMAGLEEEKILLSKLEQLFGGREQVLKYQSLKTNFEKIDFVYHSPVVSELFKLQLQALKKSNHELADEGSTVKAA